ISNFSTSMVPGLSVRVEMEAMSGVSGFLKSPAFTVSEAFLAWGRVASAGSAACAAVSAGFMSAVLLRTFSELHPIARATATVATKAARAKGEFMFPTRVLEGM
ncbi:MAG: hypothetical protein OES69_15355, partial [Myxococcales bacterium]|nr:hypothetical protein [Myxococcales bacterium]